MRDLYGSVRDPHVLTISQIPNFSCIFCPALLSSSCLSVSLSLSLSSKLNKGQSSRSSSMASSEEQPKDRDKPPTECVLHKTKTIQFFGRSTPIVLQNDNGPCPLLAICTLSLTSFLVSGVLYWFRISTVICILDDVDWCSFLDLTCSIWMFIVCEIFDWLVFVYIELGNDVWLMYEMFLWWFAVLWLSAGLV